MEIPVQMSMCYTCTAKSGPRSSIAGLFALLALAPMLRLANGQTAQPTTSPVPTLIVNAEEVSLDLVIHDKKDRAVLDLKPGDIAVFDAGSPVTLNSLRLVSGKPDRDCLVTRSGPFTQAAGTDDSGHDDLLRGFLCSGDQGIRRKLSSGGRQALAEGAEHTYPDGLSCVASERRRWQRAVAVRVDDYVFASETMKGKQPYWPDNLMKRHIRPVAKANGSNKILLSHYDRLHQNRVYQQHHSL
jgi:hypothetical protein